MNTPDSTESFRVKPIGNRVPNPAYPAPPGGRTPDLALAVWPNQQGASIQPMPDPGKPDPVDYVLSGDPTMGGVDPSNSAPPAPNLAGVDGWPPEPSSLMPNTRTFPEQTTEVIQPDYGMPDIDQPGLQPFNQITSGIYLHVPAEFEADPLMPGITSYNQPYGLAMHNVTSDPADLWQPDPVLADLTRPDLPNGITPVIHNPDQPDPLLPELQNPQLFSRLRRSLV
jgi:hypothetical protein